MGEKRQTQIKEFLQKENIRNYTQLSKFIFEYNNYPRDKNFFEDKCSDYFSSVLYLDGLFRKNKIEKLKSFFPNNMWTQNNTGAPFNFTQTSTADEFQKETEDASDKSLVEKCKEVQKSYTDTIMEIERHLNKKPNQLLIDSAIAIADGDINKIYSVYRSDTKEELISLVKSWGSKVERVSHNVIIPNEDKIATKFNEANENLFLHKRPSPQEFNIMFEKKKGEGVKHNNNKLEMSRLFEQFPDALQAIVLCSTYGAKKYKETDVWDNFKKVPGGSKTYEDALVRHFLDDKFDKDSGMPHLFHRAWNALSALQLWIEEEGIDIQEYSTEKLKEFENKFA